MKIIFFGTPHFVIPILEVLTKKFEVSTVITAPDRKAGRKQLITPSAVKKFCMQDRSNIPVMTPLSFDENTLKQIHALRPDLFVVAAYGYILPDALLKIPPFGAINIHPSLLPKYRGPTPVPSAILHGETVSGVTIIKMDDKMDHGPILSMQPYTLHSTDTTETLLNHLFILGAEALPDVITQYTSGKLEPVPQDETKVTYTKKIEKTDGFINLDSPPDIITIKRMIHAYYPWPTVWTSILIKGREVRIKFLPGGKIQMEGKNPVPMKEFLNGYPEAKTALEKLQLKENT